MFYVLVVVMTCVRALGYMASFIIISGFWHTCIRFDNLHQLNTCSLYIHNISFRFPILETNPRPLLISIQSWWQSLLDGLFRLVGVLSICFLCRTIWINYIFYYLNLHSYFIWTQLWLNPYRPSLYNYL